MRVYHLLAAEHALDDIAKRRIRISRFADLNDPFELLAAKVDDRQIRRAMRSWRVDFDREFGLLCFSGSWKSPVLWSHYADKHRGICLGFDLDDSLVESVNYSASRIPPRFEGTGAEQKLTESFVKDLLRTKYSHWAYEEEVRVFVRLDPSTEEGGSYFFPFDDRLVLREVVVGPYCLAEIGAVRSLVRGLYDSTTVVKARLAFKWFAVVNDERSVREENEYWSTKQVNIRPSAV